MSFVTRQVEPKLERLSNFLDTPAVSVKGHEFTRGDVGAVAGYAAVLAMSTLLAVSPAAREDVNAFVAPVVAPVAEHLFPLAQQGTAHLLEGMGLISPLPQTPSETVCLPAANSVDITCYTFDGSR